MKHHSDHTPTMASMRLLLLGLVALWAVPHTCHAEGEEVEHLNGQASSSAGEQSGEKVTKAFSKELCNATVRKVQQSGKYTEESIVPVCNEMMKSPKCDFFAEALSLASSHSDFDSRRFCANMDEAHFCADVMDKLLMSTPVSDLAFGECERAEKTPDDARCRKMKKMLAYAVDNEDLDTLRACYMLEAFTNLTTAQELKETKESPPIRIISSSSKELDDAGEGKNVKVNIVGQPDIVVQPVPLEPIGTGKGKVAQQKEAKGIITEPIPVAGGAAAPAAATTAAATAPAAAPTIVTAPMVAAPAPSAVAFHVHSATPVVRAAAPQQAIVAPHQQAAGPASTQPAAVAQGDTNQSLVPHITAVQIHNATIKSSSSNPAAKAAPIKAAPAKTPKQATVNNATGHDIASASSAQNASTEVKRPALRATTAAPSKKLEKATATAATPKPEPAKTPADSKGPVKQQSAPATRVPAKADSSSNSSHSQVVAPSASKANSSAPTRRAKAGLAQARLVAQVHTETNKSLVAQGAAAQNKDQGKKDDYGGFLSKFISY